MVQHAVQPGCNHGAVVCVELSSKRLPSAAALCTSCSWGLSQPELPKPTKAINPPPKARESSLVKPKPRPRSESLNR